MSARSAGVGHLVGTYGGWGDNDTGYGDPFHVTGAYVLSPADGRIPDDGGAVVRLAGAFATAGPYTVTLGGKTCRSGVAGRASACFTNTARTTLAFVAPRLAPGDHDLVLEWAGGSETLTAALRTVRRHRASEVYALRRLLPPARRLGARLLDDERLLIGSEELP